MLNIPKEVKELFEKDSVRKNVRIHFPNGERADITNSNLIAESFSFTESVMSQSEFRFGLCEASMVEFECFGVDNIKGYEIEVFHEIDISSLGEEFIAEYGITSEDVAFPYYRVPYGKFKVDEALRQADMVRRNVTAYSIMNQRNWKFNDLTEEIITSFLWKYNDNLNFSIESIEELLTYNEKNMEKGFSTQRQYGDIVPLGEINGKYYEMQVFYAEYYPTSQPYTDYVWILKEEYKKEYIFAIKEVRNIIKELGFKLPKKQLSFVNFTDIICAFDNGDSKIPKNKKLKYILSDVLEPSNSMITFPYFRISKTITQGEWLSGPSANINIPQRIKIVEYSDNGNVSNVIHETLDFDNSVYFKCNVPLFESVSNFFVTVATPYKKNIKMQKYTASTDKYEDITESVYGYKPNNLDSLRDLVESSLELKGSFGTYDRSGVFTHIFINDKLGLTPSKTLVPSKSLVPRGIKGEVLQKGNYSSLWYDDFKTKPYDRVVSIYKNEDGEEAYAEYLIVDIESDTYNASDYQAYSLTENTLIQNGTFTEAQITEILQTVANSLIGLQYMPFEMDCVGLPYLEAGDAVLVETQNGNFQTLVLDRRIDGIQSLKDNLNAN